MERRTFVRACSAAVAWAAAGPARGSSGAGLSEGFLTRLRERMATDRVPGASIAVIADGAVAWAGAVGVKDTATRAPVTADTVFFAASLSKPVFAYAVLGLVDAGKIGFDRPLSSYLKLADLPADPRAARLTARHVLSHSTGLQNWRFAKDEPLAFRFAPGEQFRYSGEGFYLLQRVVEHVTTQPFAAWMRSAVLEPFGMADSSSAWSERLAGRQPTYYRKDGSAMVVDLGPALAVHAAKSGKPLEQWRADDVAAVTTAATETTWPDVKGGFPPLPAFFDPNAAGSLRTTAADYARFMIRVMDRPARHAAEIAETTRREMLRPQVHIDAELAWGLGWGLERAALRDFFWHWGEHFAYRTFAIGDARARSGVVVLTNSGAGAGVCAAVVEEVTQTKHPALAWPRA